MTSKEYIQKLRTAKYPLRGNKPKAMKAQMKIFESLDDHLMPDVYGNGEVIENFEKLLSEEFKKPGAIFFPSGTMAQQIALRVLCDRRGLKRVAYHPLCHLEIHEQGGIKELHHIETVLLGDADRVFTLEDLKEMDDVSVVLFELPQREIGGQLPSWDELVSMVNFCRERGIYTHLDGARIYECLPYYEKTVEEVGQLFDSVYVSFYKTFGGVTGAMLIGDEAMMIEAKIWKRRHGGDLYQLFPYIVTASEAYLRNKDKMQGYYEGAKAYAGKLSKVSGIKIIPEVPVSNMFHIHFDETPEVVMERLAYVIDEKNIALFGGIATNTDSLAKTEVYIGDAYGEVEELLVDQAIGLYEKEKLG
ncbi:MAG: beta-eliminating lyase-related protein [Vallitaleaceae bacterium]|jgi:threonine aldolase|nr:beta-eliminating lyase-related protein [Vallitaleaceae bacterium]